MRPARIWSRVDFPDAVGPDDSETGAGPTESETSSQDDAAGTFVTDPSSVEGRRGSDGDRMGWAWQNSGAERSGREGAEPS